MSFETTLTVDFVGLNGSGALNKQGTPISIGWLFDDFFVIHRCNQRGLVPPGDFIGYLDREALQKIIPEKDFFTLMMLVA